MSVLEELQSAIAAIADGPGMAVVGLGAGWGQGSGIVVGDGLVLTNAHNLGGPEVAIRFADGRDASATVAGVDADGDVAVLRTDTEGIAPLTWTDGEEVGVGSAVFALANPGGRGLRVTPGVVSATRQTFRGPRGRRIAGSIEHTAPLPRGSSGGPIVNAAGQLVGVNTHRLGGGFYLAIPADGELRRRIDALGAGQEPVRPRLGVALASARVARRLRSAVGLPARDGLLVQGVEEDSPAGRAGVRRGDLLVRAGDQSLTSSDELFAILDDLQPGAQLVLGIVRGAEDLDLTVTV